mgnify:CR=1 FL=1
MMDLQKLKPKTKEKTTEKTNPVKDTKHGAQFLKNKREKGTSANSFSGKSSKEFSRKKT